ncbi:MAG: hypothetical protein ACYTEU_11225 [Planctomycetota bacterium]
MMDRDLRKLRIIIRDNRIKPKWIGDEPDLNKAPRGGKRGGHRPSGPNRGGKRKNFHRRKPKSN